MTKTTGQLHQALRRRSEAFAGEIKALEAEQRGTRTDLSRAGSEVEDAWNHLVAALVPSLDATALDRAAQRLQLRDISGAAMQQRVTEDKARLVALASGVQNDPRWAGREGIRNEASIRVDELDDSIKPLENSVLALEHEPDFSRLVWSDYGEETYQRAFWQLSYYRDWKHADLIVEKFGPRLGVADFPALRKKYLEEKAALNGLVATRGDWQTRVKELDALEAQLAKAQEDASTLEARHLAWARGRARAHLDALPPAELTRMLASDEELRIAAARVAGARAKVDYLEALQRELIAPALADLRAAADKAQRDMFKLSRPKNTARRWTDAEYAQRIGKDRTDSWAKRRARIRGARTRIVEFHSYDRWSPAQDFLWWDVMTDGELDGNWIREVRDRGPLHRDVSRAHATSLQDTSGDFDRDIS